MGRRYARRRVVDEEKEKEPIEYTLKNLILSQEGKYKHSIISNLSKEFLIKHKNELILNKDY